MSEETEKAVIKLTNHTDKISKMRGVYALKKGEDIVYIGQTTNISQRIGRHLVDKRKSFDGYSFFEYSGNLDDLESELIVRYSPELNKNLPNGNSLYISASKIRSDLGVNRWAFKKIVKACRVYPVYKEWFTVKSARYIRDSYLEKVIK